MNDNTVTVLTIALLALVIAVLAYYNVH